MGRLEDLDDALMGDGPPPAQRLHGPTFRPVFFRKQHEFGVAHGEEREIEAVGLDDAAGLRRCAASRSVCRSGESFIVTKPSSIKGG